MHGDTGGRDQADLGTGQQRVKKTETRDTGMQEKKLVGGPVVRAAI